MFGVKGDQHNTSVNTGTLNSIARVNHLNQNLSKPA